ncbi:MAG: hypothetical protein GY874_18125, partial [Desulfobacteraceae bacterium]|nr:hypothetical protein [Desulfobacteraceae bacterium]
MASSTHSQFFSDSIILCRFIKDIQMGTYVQVSELRITVVSGKKTLRRTEEGSFFICFFQPCSYHLTRVLCLFQSKAVEFVLSLAPRFGSPADFSLLFADDSSNRTDYVLGTILVGAVLFGFFLLWMLLLGLFACLGTQRVGFLAGSPMAPREMGDEGVSMEVEPPKNEDSENGNNPKPYRGTRVGVVRFTFLLSCISVITVSALSMYVRGFNDLKDSSDDAKSIVEMFHQNATTGEIMVRDMIRESNDFQGKRDIIVDELNSDSFCPDPNLDTLTGQPINVLREELIQTLSSLNDFEQKNLDKLQKLGFDKVRLNT